MANLKGGDFDKQIRDAHFRTKAIGESREDRTDSQAHSQAILDSRAEKLTSFAEHCQEQGLEGKLNELLTNENINSFLDNRLEDLAKNTQETYVSGFNSMIKGLEHSNIDIPADKEIFSDRLEQIREMPNQEIEINRAIENIEDKINSLYEARFESGVIADIQNEMGLRISEALEVANNLEKYLNEAESKIENLVGKGNNIYQEKDISSSLISKIESMEKDISKSTYKADLKEIGEKSHNFRYTYAQREFQQKIENGVEHNQALKEVSQELNHSREEITSYYLARA